MDGHGCALAAVGSAIGVDIDLSISRYTTQLMPPSHGHSPQAGVLLLTPANVMS